MIELLTAIVVALGQPGATAAAPNPPHLHSEWTIAAGVSKSVDLFESTSGRSYAVQTVGWARELTTEHAPGLLRGRFAWGVEAMPLFAQFSPSNIYGVGFAPVVWRWNFTPQPKWSAFAELSMGGLWTSQPIPDKTSSINFSAHWGGGVRFLPRGRHAWLVAYRFQHFSNGNQFGSNPGVNSHVVLAGWTHRS
jgi:opacity protein-like surface antigen